MQVSELSAILEREGLPGLCFSLGVAFNMLPALAKSARNTWHSLWLRGGLRTRRWRGLQLLLVTILSNALRRAEEITLAAEACAYDPHHVRHVPIRKGRADGWLLAVGLLLLAVALFL